MSSRLQQQIEEVMHLCRNDFPDLEFLECDPEPLDLPLSGIPVRFLKVELPYRQFLHLHSVSLIDGAGEELKVGSGKVTLSSTYGAGDADAAAARLFDADGDHDVAFHTMNDSSPWGMVELADVVVAERLILRNRAGKHASRAAGISVSVSPDGAQWTKLYDGLRRADQFVSEATRAGGADATKAELAAASAAAGVLACRYADVARMLPEKVLAAGEISEIKGCINRVVLAPRQLEWTSHGVRRSFRYWTREEMEDYVALTTDVCRDLGELSPDVCLGFGSVLSIIRDNELMKHDDDLDVIVALDGETAPTLQVALSLVRDLLVAKGYKVQGKFFSHWHVLRRRRKVDVFVGIYEGGRIGWFPGKRKAFERGELFPAQVVSFLGSECLIPRDPGSYLAATYGPDWKSPMPGWKHDWDRTRYADIA